MGSRPYAAGAALLSVLACRTLQAETPAVIIDPTAQSRVALRRAVSTALNGAPVTVADDALMHESVLVIDRASRRDPSGLPLNGRDLGMPERFRLMKGGAQCVLVHERSGRRFTLTATTCAPL